jgi:hypothetical protein
VTKPDPQLVAYWNARLAAEGLGHVTDKGKVLEDLPPIPREVAGLNRSRRYEDNTALLDAELAKPWQEQAANRATPGAEHHDRAGRLDEARKVDASGLRGTDREVWALYVQGATERQLAAALGVSRRVLYGHFLGPLLRRFRLPHRAFREDRRFYRPRKRNQAPNTSAPDAE